MLKHCGMETMGVGSGTPRLLRNLFNSSKGEKNFHKSVFVKGVIITCYCGYFRM